MGNKIHSGSSKRLNIGCARKLLNGYDNLDIKDIPGIEYPRADARKLPIKDNVYDEILVRWVLEHFGQKEMINVLKEWHRVLKPGGLLRIVTNHQEAINRGLFRREINWEEWNFLTFGSQTNTLEGCHKIGFNRDILMNYLTEATFENIEIELTWKCREADGRLKCPALIVRAIK